MAEPIVRVDHLTKSFRIPGGESFNAVDDVSFQLFPGSVLGIVGESGSGKSTLARCMVRLDNPNAGQIRIDGTDVLSLRRAELRRFRRVVQLVFQNPHSSLNPRMTVEQNVSAGIVAHNLAGNSDQRRAIVVDKLGLVGLDESVLPRYPRSFSGGQRQRIAIARALAVDPKVLVCDEPISSLDVSVQAQVVNLLQDMQRRLGLTIIFVAHDLAVVRYLCDEIMVMYRGRSVEFGPRQQIYEDAQHEYTRSLLDAIPVMDPGVRRRDDSGARNL